jgi:hypothetical protein
MPIIAGLFSPPAIPALRESSPHMFIFVNLTTVQTTILCSFLAFASENQAAAARPGP